MPSTFSALRALMVAGAVALTVPVHAATLYGIDGADNLVSFDSANPGSFLSSVAISGLNGTLVAIDFRPATRGLYALDDSGMLYSVNITTGAATGVGPTNDLNGANFSMDFNPTIDRLRVVSNTNDNYVYNPNTGVAAPFTPVFYAPGDPNEGANPDVSASAYNNNFVGTPTAQLYSIDTFLDVLTKQANSAGVLTTVGPLGFNLSNRASFDIGDGNIGYVTDNRSFYTIDLNTGALTFVGKHSETLYGLSALPVPEPASWAMMIGGFGTIGAVLRRRRRDARTLADA